MWRINHAHTDHSAPGTAQGHRLIHNGYSSSMHAHESTGNDHVVKQCCIACSPLAVFLGVVELCVCMWSHVLLQCLHVCSKTEIHRRCDSALQHVSILLGMVRCCIGEVVSAARRTAPTCRVRRNPGRTPFVRLLCASRVFWHWRPRRLCLNM